MKASEALKILRDNPIFWSRLGFCYDPPLYDGDGKPLCFSRDFERFAKYHRQFCDSGVGIHTCILHSGWVGVGKYDYSLTDEILRVVFENIGAEYFVPRIKLNVPIDWCAENPEEVFVYYEGPRKAEEIKALVGTPKHDILGYEAPNGYYNSCGGWKDNRPNVGGLISLQSFSSKKWLRDAGVALQRLIRRLEDGKYGKKTLAYHIAFGSCGETSLWGRSDSKTGDFGISNQKLFYEWGLSHYGSSEALRKAWRERCGDIVPSPSERYGYGTTPETQIRSFGKDRLAIDYDTFMSEVNANGILHFSRIVKEETGGKAVGSFYGYVMEVSRSAYTGYLGWEKLLSSDCVDFFAAPKSYRRSSPGEPGGELAPAFSINRRKLWLDECDNRTHLANEPSQHPAKNIDETKTVIWREFAKNISHNSGYWWMDLGGGWYDSEDILTEVSNVRKTNDSLRRIPFESVSEILAVTDTESFKYADERFNQDNIEETLRNMQLCGTCIDTALFSDLPFIDLSRYKLVVFLNLFCADENVRNTVQALKNDGKAVLFHYISGICNPEFDRRNVSSFTGFDIEFEDSSAEGAPCGFYISDKSCEALYTENEKVRTARKGSVYLNSALPIDILTFRRIAESCGCHMYAPAECTVYADNRIVGIFPRSEIKDALYFRKTVTAVNAVTGEKHIGVNKLPLKLKAKAFAVYTIE